MITEMELGSYRILSCLKKSLHKVCYHVIDQKGREAVLKAVSLDHIPSLEWLNRLEVEQALLEKFKSKHTRSNFYSGKTENLFYWLQDFVYDEYNQSSSLRALMDRSNGKLSEYQSFILIQEILKGLKEAKEFEDSLHKGLFHGNLKPENILLAQKNLKLGELLNYEVELVDFSPYNLFTIDLIAHIAANQLPSYDDDEKKRALSTFYQSFDYTAPENIPSYTADIYSVGVILYEMLTGVLPKGRFFKPSMQNPNISQDWDEVVMRALSFDSQLRFQEAGEFLAVLEERLSHLFQKGFTDDLLQEVNQEEKEEKQERLSLTPKGMVYLPAASFFVGSEECGQDATPVYESSTEGVYVDRTLVTNGQFARFVKETGYLTTAEQENGAPIWDGGQWHVLEGICWKNPFGQNLPEDFEDHPVVQVTYADAIAYSEWLSRRLPTEEEWEYAARGGEKDLRYPTGQTLSRAQANIQGESTTAVAKYAPNHFGLYDMAGNVWEWTSSFYQPYPGNNSANPHFGEEYRIIRGGCWMHDAGHALISYRNANQPAYCYPTVGFRTVKDGLSK